MGLIKKLILTVLIFFGIFFLISLFMESQWRVERSVVIEAPKEKIFPYLNNLRNWYEWTPWNKEVDATLEWSYEGPGEGVGAVAYWEGIDVPLGRVELTMSEPSLGVEYELALRGDFNAKGELKMEAAGEFGEFTKVIWADWGDIGGSVMGRLMISGLDQTLGPKFERGLANLKDVVEKSGSSAGMR